MPKLIPRDVVGAIWDFRLMTGAEGRIEKYRKGDATVIVTDGEGVPVPAKVTAEMLQPIEHEGKKMVTDVHLAKNADNVFRLRLP